MCRQDKKTKQKKQQKARQNKNTKKASSPGTSLHSPIRLTWEVCAQALSLPRRIRSLYIPWAPITTEWTTVRSDSLWPPSNSVYGTSKTLLKVILCVPRSQGRYCVSCAPGESLSHAPHPLHRLGPLLNSSGEELKPWLCQEPSQWPFVLCFRLES